MIEPDAGFCRAGSVLADQGYEEVNEDPVDEVLLSLTFVMDAKVEPFSEAAPDLFDGSDSVVFVI